MTLLKSSSTEFLIRHLLAIQVIKKRFNGQEVH